MVSDGVDLTLRCAVICLTVSVVKAITVPLMKAKPETKALRKFRRMA